MKEVWKVYPQDNRYEISSLGSVRRTRDKLPIRIHSDKNGYLNLQTYFPGRKYIHRLMHRVVLETFTGACPAGYEASHRDNNRANNRISNLFWESHASNMARKKQFGTLYNQPVGEKHRLSKLTDLAVRDILTNQAQYSRAYFSRKYRVDAMTILAVIRRQTWKHIQIEGVRKNG